MTTNPLHWRLRVAKEFGSPINDVIEGLRDDGYSLYATASILSISPHTLKLHCTRAGITFQHYAQSPDRKKHVMVNPLPRARFIEHNGQRLQITEWARRTGISRSTIANRLALGWDVQDALSQPPRW